jgi:uncharacterized protein
MALISAEETTATITPLEGIIVPGLGDSDPEHWQTQWHKNNPGWSRVYQDDWYEPNVESWISRLDEKVVTALSPPILIAHSCGCATVVRWAERYGAAHPVLGAFLVAPPDVEGAGRPDQVRRFAPVTRQSLPFPSMVVRASDDWACDWHRSTFCGRLGRGTRGTREWSTFEHRIGSRTVARRARVA